MPDMNLVIPAVATIAALVLIVGSIGWLLGHPAILIPLAMGIGGISYLLARRHALSNRV